MRVLPPDHPRLAVSLNNQAMLLLDDRAEWLEGQVRAVRTFQELPLSDTRSFANRFSSRRTAPSQNSRLGMQARIAKAELLLERSQAIFEKALGLEHPHVGEMLHNRAALLKDKVWAVWVF